MTLYDAYWLAKSVITNDNTIEMQTLIVIVCPENAEVSLRQLAVDTVGTWQYKGSLTTQSIDNKVRVHVREIGQSMSKINKQGTDAEQGDL